MDKNQGKMGFFKNVSKKYIKAIFSVLITAFRYLSRFVVGSSVATKMPVFGGKFVPSVHNN